MRRLVVILSAIAACLALAACSEGPSGGGGSGGSSGGSGGQKEQSSGGEDKGGGKSITVGLPTAEMSFANADIAVAQEKGFFKKHGVNVKVENFGSGLKVVQAGVAGGVDIGGSSIEPVVNAGSRGQKLTIIGSYTDRLAVAMVTPKEIGSPQQLKGQRLGIQDVGAFREVMTRLVLQRAGLTPDDVSYRPVESNGYTGALVAGQIRSGILQQEQAVDAMQKDGKLHVLSDLYKAEPRYFYGTYFAKQDWVESNREAAVGFLAAITEAHRFMYDNKAETVKIAAEATGFSPAVTKRAYDILLTRNAVFPVNSGLQDERLRYTLNKMEELDLTAGTTPDLESLVDRGPIDEAIKKAGGPRTGDPRWR